MEKFGIKVSKGYTETLIKTFDTQEEAMEFGAKHFMNLPKGEGIVTCFSANFEDGDESSIPKTRKIYHVWY